MSWLSCNTTIFVLTGIVFVSNSLLVEALGQVLCTDAALLGGGSPGVGRLTMHLYFYFKVVKTV